MVLPSQILAEVRDEFLPLPNMGLSGQGSPGLRVNFLTGGSTAVVGVFPPGQPLQPNPIFFTSAQMCVKGDHILCLGRRALRLSVVDGLIFC